MPDFSETHTTLHDFSDVETNELNTLVNTLVNTLKNTFRDKFTSINDKYSRSKNDLDSIRRKINAAEKDTEDEYIAKLRADKERLDHRVISIGNDIDDLREKIGSFKAEMKTLKQRQEDLRKKIDDSRRYSEKDSITQRQIENLKHL